MRQQAIKDELIDKLEPLIVKKGKKDSETIIMDTS